MTTDIFGCHVDLVAGPQVEHWNATLLGFLSHGAATPVHLGKLMESAPEFALGHTVKGLFCVLLGRREMFATARDAGKTARRLMGDGSADMRSRHMLAALEAMLIRDPYTAVAQIEQILLAAPHDTLAMKLSHGIRFLVGDASGMRRSVERVLAAHGPDHAGRGYLLGCHAFALEETGAYDAAQRTGLEALGTVGDDAWGLHAVAHVHDMTARADDGIALIETHTDAWGKANNFRYHVWWHKALLHLDRGETDIVLALYDQKIRHDQTDDYRDIANATSLLTRLELEGVAVGDRWNELAAFSEARVEDGCLVFADLHYMLALIGDERTDARDRLTAQLAAQTGTPDALAPVAAHPGQATAAGLAAFGEGRYELAFCQLEAARPRLHTIGGSHAQRDVFERMTIEAGLRAGLLERTETILKDRISRRGGTVDHFADSRLSRIAAARQHVPSAMIK